MALYRAPDLGTFAWQPQVLAMQNAPPGSPAKGDRYIIAGTPSGAWTGYAWYLATYTGSGWIFDQPTEGWRAYDQTANVDRIFNGTTWLSVPPSVHAASHKSAGGDLIKLDELAAPTDITDLDATTGQHGLLKKLGGGTANFLRADGAWASPGGSGMGYALQVRATSLSPQDGITYFLGSTVQPRTSSGNRLYIPKAGTLKVCYFWWDGSAVTGSNESISVYIRVNDTTDYLVETIGDASLQKLFDKTDLNISLVQGDYIEIKMVCPTWGTNPTNVFLGGVVYIE